MIEQIVENIFKIEIPLPDNPLKCLNSYFIKGNDRNLLIDTGFNRVECRTAMDQALKELEVSMNNTDIFVTHCHADHSGLVGYLAGPKTRIYASNYTAKALNHSTDFLHRYNIVIKQGGLLEMGFREDSDVHPGYRYRSKLVDNATIVYDKTFIQVGDFNLQCIMTPGHAPDHTCLYDSKHKLLFSGDHILGQITPNNTIWDTPEDIKVDYLDQYYRSLAKIEVLDIELALPGHRGILTNCRERIQELKLHHKNRLNQILEILGSKAMTGAEVASKMRWDISVKTWEEFPLPQKYFATGEALSHLSHLVCTGVLTKYLQDGVVYYQKS